VLSRRKFLAFLAALPGARWFAASALAAEAARDTKIVRAKIHPALGVARVGNSAAEFFIGPEVPDEPTLPPGGYKDATGALKRQAARFRLYGYNAAGEVVRELTAADANITWTAHLANTKAAWYEFHLALDLPEAATASPDLAARRRNARVRGAARAQLVIDPGPRSVSGRSVSGTDAAQRFDTGRFFNVPVPLGELRTDEAGRLLVLGGHGLARSRDGSPPEDFCNNDNWHDDISDGPVDAKVTLAGAELPVEGAWVMVAPPNYAPGLQTVRTLHDLLHDHALAWGLARPADKISFAHDIAPVFRRLTGLQWVNQGFADVFGAGAPHDAEKMLPRLADASAANKAFRQEIYAKFRNPADKNLGKALWPFLYGDGWDFLNMNEADVTRRIPSTMAPLSDTQLGRLRKWADGDFVNDLTTAPAAPKNLAELPVAAQPAALDEAALAYCLADAFHPGCELTWPVRHRSLYGDSMRFRRRTTPEPDYGEVLTPRAALAAGGPLAGLAPGGLTRWMAVPWQTDTASCLWSYDQFRTSATLPSFWPARVPNQVLAERDYLAAVNPALPPAQRRAAFATRRNWFRGFPVESDLTGMVRDYHRLGIVEERPGAADPASGLPARMFVESRPAFSLPEDRPGAAGATPAKENAFTRLARAVRGGVNRITRLG
jgi:hypothetical protein